MRYRPKKDPWAVCVFALAVLVCMGLGILITVMEDLLAGVICCVPLVLFLGWIYFGCVYEITSSHVVVRTGPLPWWRVRIDELVEAVPTDSISATAHFAFSSDAIRISSSKKIWGLLPPTVSISPRDKNGFLKALAEASPNLEQLEDGSVHRRSETAS